MTDWQEAYFDLLNKVECECVQKGDLVPIWDQFKAMSAELAKWKALAETLAGALDEMQNIALHGKDCDAICGCECGLYEASEQSAEALRQYKEARDV